jgi:uncharacterized membrane protein (UPF0127 family)
MDSQRSGARIGFGRRAGRRLWRGRCAAAVLLVAGVCGCGDEPVVPTVEINGARWQVELAMTDAARYRGLSGRRNVSPGHGMLFIYPDAAERQYVMRGCLVQLDIAFIGPDLRVIRTWTMVVETDPRALQEGGRVYHSDGAAQYVLEVPAGALDAAGVQPGDAVRLLGPIPDATKAEPGP